MSLDITIKQGKKVVLTNNFYGFIRFNDSDKRHTKAHEMCAKDVVDFASYKEFIEKAIVPEQQQYYLDLVDAKKPIKVSIW